MKTSDLLKAGKLFLASIIGWLFAISNLYAQAPQTFNYQGVIRNSAGPVPDQMVSIQVKLISSSAIGTVLYTETFNPTTNGFGLVNLQIGKGTPLSGSFSGINWSAGSYFLEIDADVAGGSNYVKMGVSQLESVPYALFSQSSGTSETASWKDSTGIVYSNNKVGIGNSNPTSMLSVNGSKNLPTDTALFEVKDKKGNTVFAVYEEGVRMYVKESPSVGSRAGFSIGGRNTSTGVTQDLMQITPDSIRFYLTEGVKGSRSGFAVGGRSPSKGFHSDIFRVTPDSVRIYVNDNGTKGSRGGFAVGGRNPAKGPTSNYLSLTHNNYFIGEDAGKQSTGLYNSFLGYQNGYSNTTGAQNVFLGFQSGFANRIGSQNVYIGYLTGKNIDSASSNIFIGYECGMNSIKGQDNIFLGSQAGLNNSGSENLFLGHYAGINNTSGQQNIFAGNYAGYVNSTGSSNIYIGEGTGSGGAANLSNIFIGSEAGAQNAGNYNIMIGENSGGDNTHDNNTFLGFQSGHNNLGSNNVFIGANAGYNDTASNSVFIGFNAGSLETLANRLYINNSSANKTAALIYGEFDNKRVTINGKLGIGITAPAYAIDIPNTANAAGQGRANAWNTYSDIRFKEQIVSIPNAIDLIEQLNGVTFNWKDSHLPSSGFIAQEVEKVLPTLVQTDNDGYKSMDYSRITPYLVNALKEQQLIIEKQQSSIQALTDENKSIKFKLQKIDALQSELDKIKAAIGMPLAK